jgi:hypothetical protein
LSQKCLGTCFTWGGGALVSSRAKKNGKFRWGKKKITVSSINVTLGEGYEGCTYTRGETGQDRVRRDERRGGKGRKETGKDVARRDE